VIPARGGSKGIKHKNIAKLAQVPLVDYTIKAAVDCALFAQVVVNSDDAQILSRPEYWNVTAMKRPADIARDDSPTAQQ
jgi:CMP-N,N'-diacetyllegionaminic acid synthase